MQTYTSNASNLKKNVIIHYKIGGGPLAHPERLCGILEQAGDMLCSRKINFVVE